MAILIRQPTFLNIDFHNGEFISLISGILLNISFVISISSGTEMNDLFQVFTLCVLRSKVASNQF